MSLSHSHVSTFFDGHLSTFFDGHLSTFFRSHISTLSQSHVLALSQLMFQRNLTVTFQMIFKPNFKIPHIYVAALSASHVRNCLTIMFHHLFKVLFQNVSQPYFKLSYVHVSALLSCFGTVSQSPFKIVCLSWFNTNCHVSPSTNIFQRSYKRVTALIHNNVSIVSSS